jgi:branched-chain amino acid transport system ATP-binding protein
VSGDLSLVDGRAGYGPVEVLHGVTMVFPAGSVVLLVGRNGAGKSSVLRCLAGLLRIRSGTLRWAGQDVTHLTPYQRAKNGMALIPDEHAVFADMTVRENLQLFARSLPLDPALAVFPELAGRLDQPAGTLSGGEQQMLALSHTFVRPLPVMLLDEVSRGLSPAVTARCYDALAELCRPDRTLVIVEQYIEDVLRLADLVYVLTRGEVTFAGEPGELQPEAGRGRSHR